MRARGKTGPLPRGDHRRLRVRCPTLGHVHPRWHSRDERRCQGRRARLYARRHSRPCDWRCRGALRGGAVSSSTSATNGAGSGGTNASGRQPRARWSISLRVGDASLRRCVSRGRWAGVGGRPSVARARWRAFCRCGAHAVGTHRGDVARAGRRRRSTPRALCSLACGRVAAHIAGRAGVSRGSVRARASCRSAPRRHPRRDRDREGRAIHSGGAEPRRRGPAGSTTHRRHRPVTRPGTLGHACAPSRARTGASLPRRRCDVGARPWERAGLRRGAARPGSQIGHARPAHSWRVSSTARPSGHARRRWRGHPRKDGPSYRGSWPPATTRSKHGRTYPVTRSRRSRTRRTALTAPSLGTCQPRSRPSRLLRAASTESVTSSSSWRPQTTTWTRLTAGGFAACS